ncbi:hypothetical protein [uncultured Alsobacter sp.]|uniref:hypothetical protein n=1 Tax=uncultured Alsobacter sp. TaxID=1748258 RepID=UPI0025FF3D1B|nr:hypothetical protein [uncultured Alsobacter sp.]
MTRPPAVVVSLAVCRRSTRPSPSSSKLVLVSLPSAEVTDTICDTRVPSTARAVNVSVRRPSAPVTEVLSARQPSASDTKEASAAVPVEPSAWVKLLRPSMVEPSA